MSETTSETSSTSRVAFDDESLLQDPQNSSHWKSLSHQDGDALVQNIKELITTTNECFQEDIQKPKNGGGETLALWSCISGYVEALATHKHVRYRIFPIPLQALKRLVQEEFLPFLKDVQIPQSSNHRETVRAISNAVWAKALPKPNVRDEIHANSLYVCLRGSIDKKSLDCFGAALVTIAGCQIKGLHSSLTLSEDHAYERHSNSDGSIVGTCEVTVPGNTKLAKSKRGRDIKDTFSKDTKFQLTPGTSWLYMASNPVVCDSIPMTLVAVIGNINCTIEKTKRGSFASKQLYEFKRDLLWVLWEQGHMSKFPFGLIELGDCEEHCGSPRSEEWVTVPDIGEPILMNEKLFYDAIQINKNVYNDSQTYPYFYAGHYHKDAGNEGPEHEYRLVHAMKYYAEAARVASSYRYEGVDSIQLNKHMSAAAMLIAEDVLTPKYSVGIKDARPWTDRDHAVAAGTWLLGFFDALLYWEEASGDKQFVEILGLSHKFFIGKLFQLLSEDIRRDVIAKVRATKSEDEKYPYFRQPRSRRMATSGQLIQALQKPKVAIREMELAIPSEEDDSGGGRRSKRVRRS
jgi:menin